jgi:hypothetical protein
MDSQYWYIVAVTLHRVVGLATGGGIWCPNFSFTGMVEEAGLAEISTRLHGVTL